MSEENRERLKLKEQQKNPGAALNNTLARAVTGSPGSGCLVNIISILMVLGVVLLIRACSQ
ncbi:hypothetical protein J7E38_15640 [Bacillus sp. ISL-35]|uniref:hypothetical protein n=1 Tax=Bacillus sp. ISL-35 TaxID=2819122 RepID=UPI001BEA357E|nr:hypothetical protein [Bacillus sp. ISL-35]MBT2680443.1 hypothetical protein [Bacillus sp. ISL-35]MBT2704264.1 hypothetical protein [Chryseobacterium sp. ISL-80]